MDLKLFYTALGRVVYAIAKADGAIQHEEVASVFHFVITQIIAIEQENFDGRSALEAFYTEKEFNRLRDENVSMTEAFDQFIQFYDLNKNACDTNMKATCLHIIEKVALAFNGIEASELAIIENVRKKFNEN
jgi:hypothetical protein